MTHTAQSTLFNTNALFSLSGNQPYQKKEMSIPEKKAKILVVGQFEL